MSVERKVYSGEVSSAPQAPRLNNDDFRKIMMTPRRDSNEPQTPSRFAHLTPRRPHHASSGADSFFAKPNQDTTSKINPMNLTYQFSKLTKGEKRKKTKESKAKTNS